MTSDYEAVADQAGVSDPALPRRGTADRGIRCTTGDYDGLIFRALAPCGSDASAAAQLLGQCPASDRIRRAGSRDPGAGARWLLPRTGNDVAIAAVRPDGELVGVANANVVSEASATYEVAVIVAPQRRRHGVARSLLRRLAVLLPPDATLTGIVPSDYSPGFALLMNVAPRSTITRDRETTQFTVSVAAVRGR